MLGIKTEHEVAVIEMGILDFNDMDELATIVKPDICVLTNIGVCHLETFGTRDNILKEKSSMFNHLPEDGLVILNGDDDKLSTITKLGGTGRLYSME